MDEKRQTARQRTLKAGAIEFNGGGISCTLRNLSKAGAALEVVSPLGIPQKFNLFIEADNARRKCAVVWRRERRIGVVFV
ncbi:MAG: PilZ domain-containing protein [Bradyrhizobium sp.]